MSNEELAQQAQAGDRSALETLWKINQGFIHNQILKYSGYIEQEDAQQEAFFALVKAVEGFNPEAGAFTTYFSFWIRQHLQRIICKNSTLSANEQEKVIKYRQALANFEKENGREPSDLEAADLLNISPEDLDKIRQAEATDRPASLDSETADGATLSDVIRGPESPENEIIDKEYREELKSEIWDVVDTLPPEEADTIRDRYQAGQTLREVSEANGETISATAWKEKKGLRDLKRGKRGRTLRPYYAEIFGEATRGEGSGTFNRTWTSATERTALDLYEKE